MTDSPPLSESHTPPEFLPDQPRRGFFASALAIIIGAVVGLVPLVTGTLFFLDPILRRKDKPNGNGSEDEMAGFVKLNITLEELKESPVPMQVPVISTKVDKWNRYPDQPIGSVYLQMADDGETVAAFNVTCPHLGCAVEYRENPQENVPEFYCPCHRSAFKLTGERKNEIPKRDMDALESKIVVNEDGEEEIWVKYQEFRATKAEKVPV